MRQLFRMLVLLLFASPALPQYQRQDRPSLPVAEAADGRFDVRVFGAVPNDESDDTETIQRAFDAAGQVAGTVRIPTGRFLTSRRLQITKSLEIEGAPGAILVNQGNGIVILAQGIDVSWVKISGLIVDGNRMGQKDAGLIQINNGKMYLKDIDVVNGGEGLNWVDGIAASWNGVGPQTTGRIVSCYAWQMSKAGIYVSAGCLGVHLEDCMSWANGAKGGNLHSTGFSIVGESTHIIRCEAFDNAGAGILFGSMLYFGQVVGPWNSVATDNKCHHNGWGGYDSAGIMLCNAYGEAGAYGDISIIDNHCNYNNGEVNAQRGILAQNVRDLTIRGNFCKFNRLQGIMLQNVHGAVISGNIVTDNVTGGAPTTELLFIGCSNIKQD